MPIREFLIGPVCQYIQKEFSKDVIRMSVLDVKMRRVLINSDP